MSNQNQHINLPLERLFARLEAAGFAMDTARKLRLLRALDREGHRYIGRWDELKYLLAPFIARTAEEQSRFYEIYAEFQAECKAELSNPSNIQTRAAHQTLPQTLKRFWPLLVLLLALLVYGIIEIATPPKPKTLSLNIYQDVVLREGRETLIINRTATRDTSGFRWEVRDATTGDLEYTAVSFHLRWKAIGAGREKHIILRAPEGRQKEIFEPLADALRLMVHCRDSLSASLPNIPASPLIKGQNYTFSVDTSQEVAALWIFSNGDSLRGGQIPKKFEEEGQFLLRLRRYRPGQEDYCYTEQEIPITVGADKPFLRTADLKRDHPRFQLGLKSWFWLLLLLPLLPALWLLQRWYQKRRERSPRRGLAEIEADYPIYDSGPYFIPYLPQEEKISVPPAFFRIADVLRRREAGIRREFDASASIRATARAGGFPSWRDQPLTRPAEYLLLIRRTDERHQQDRLFQRLAHFLEKRDAPVTAFYHDGRFERFQNQRHPEGLSLSQLYRRYADYRLIILGDAHGLVNPYATAAPTLLSAPLTELSRWPRRLVLTPEEARFWSFQEALLYQHFRLFPATTEGILKGVEALDLDEEYVPGDAPSARLRGLRPFEGFDAPSARLSGLRPFESSEQLERAEGASNARSASNIHPSNIQTPAGRHKV